MHICAFLDVKFECEHKSICMHPPSSIELAEDQSTHSCADSVLSNNNFALRFDSFIITFNTAPNEFCCERAPCSVHKQ